MQVIDALQGHFDIFAPCALHLRITIGDFIIHRIDHTGFIRKVSCAIFALHHTGDEKRVGHAKSVDLERCVIGERFIIHLGISVNRLQPLFRCQIRVHIPFY